MATTGLMLVAKRCWIMNISTICKSQELQAACFTEVMKSYVREGQFTRK